eukprot:748746-Hanusia_phi.AAC.1
MLWVGSNKVRKALHVPSSSFFFNADNGDGFSYLLTEKSLLPLYSAIAAGRWGRVQMLVYNGDTDPVRTKAGGGEGGREGGVGMRGRDRRKAGRKGYGEGEEDRAEGWEGGGRGADIDCSSPSTHSLLKTGRQHSNFLRLKAGQDPSLALCCSLRKLHVLPLPSSLPPPCFNSCFPPLPLVSVFLLACPLLLSASPPSLPPPPPLFLPPSLPSPLNPPHLYGAGALGRWMAAGGWEDTSRATQAPWTSSP